MRPINLVIERGVRRSTITDEGGILPFEPIPLLNNYYRFDLHEANRIESINSQGTHRSQPRQRNKGIILAFGPNALSSAKNSLEEQLQ